MQIRSVGIDLGKTTFHVVALNAAGKVLLRKKFTQKQLITFTANMQTSWIGMEACSGAHFLGRVLREQGHDVKLIPAQFVKPSEEAAWAWCSIRRPPRQARTIAVRSLAQRS
jgi:transposase